MARIRRMAGPLAWTLGAVVAHAVVPYELARWLERPGRAARHRPAVRAAALATVAAGGTLMAWAFASHYRAAPQGWTTESGLTPGYLLRGGPYQLSRNPIYAGEAVVWLGWALFYDRPTVWAGLAAVSAAFTQVVRWEERQLLERFGEDYRVYQSQVPRWIPVLSD